MRVSIDVDSDTLGSVSVREQGGGALDGGYERGEIIRALSCAVDKISAAYGLKVDLVERPKS